MVCFLLLLYMPWPKITWERKGLFALHVLDTVHSWGKSGRKKFRVGTWSKELKQRQWRNIAYWFTFRGSLTSHFIQVRGYPGVSPTTVEWAFPYQMVNQENASPTRHWPMWWKKFLNCGFFFPKKHNLCWADKNQHHAEISCKLGISGLYAPTRFRCGFLEPHQATTFQSEVVEEHIFTTIGTVTSWADKRTPISYAVVCWTEIIRTYAIGPGDCGMLNPSLRLL